MALTREGVAQNLIAVLLLCVGSTPPRSARRLPFPLVYRGSLDK